jgi:hypothetical protein
MRECDNLRHSLFVALADCLENDGHLVCNPGKLQRIAVGVLQGRLPGVNIDGRVVVESIPLNREDSWRMFEVTNPFRTPFSPSIYRERLEAYLRENPRVDAPWLRQEVEEYINDPLNRLVDEEDGAFGAGGGGTEEDRRPDVDPENPGAAGGGGAEARLRE